MGLAVFLLHRFTAHTHPAVEYFSPDFGQAGDENGRGAPNEEMEGACI